MKSRISRADSKKFHRRLNGMRHQPEDAAEFVRRANRGCTGKRRYSKIGAKAARDRMLANGASRGGIYRCDICGGWHITSHPRRSVR